MKLGKGLGWVVVCCIVFGPMAGAANISIIVSDPQFLPAMNSMVRNLDHEDGTRILPVLSTGSVQALSDLRRFDRIDAAVLPSDTMQYALSEGLVSDQISDLKILAKLGPLPVVIIARREIKSLADLQGKRIATGPAGSAAFVTGELIFNDAKISFTRVAAINSDSVTALQRGDADAAVLLDTGFAKSFTGAGDFHALAIPLTNGLAVSYTPAVVTEQQLPGLIATAEVIETVAVGLTLAVREPKKGSLRFATLRDFGAALFAAAEAGSLGENANLNASVPGWQRALVAEEALRLSSIQSE
jgi:uncharacterized protein